MRLYRLGDSGTAVRDIQDRLNGLGYACRADPRSEFGETTLVAVESFQRRRGLPADGIVGPETWRALYEAGYRLGDRLLYLRRPMLRGDDVAELQRRLNSLGFDAGKIDGILGPNSLRALVDFQQNRHMAEDGIAGPRTLTELHLVARATQKTGREAIREREWLRELPRSVVGARVFLDPACRDPEEADKTWLAAGETARRLQEEGAIPLLSRSSDTSLPERIRARRANRVGASLIVSFQFPYAESASVFFFASTMSRSEAGALLAAAIGDRLGLPFEGRAHPMLKETRAPAVVVATAEMNEATGRAVAEAIGAFFASARTDIDEAPPRSSSGDEVGRPA
jgi:N-acetylmuramoyl-L-alanine amidase